MSGTCDGASLMRSDAGGLSMGMVQKHGMDLQKIEHPKNT
jgi:hypothetical protein